MKRFLIILLGTFLLAGCASRKVDGIERLDNARFERRMHRPDHVVLDVRTPEEYAAGHIPGAVLMNVLDTAAFRTAISGLDRNKHYLVYCRSGKRSMTASRQLKSIGIRHVADLEKGISGWKGATTRE